MRGAGVGGRVGDEGAAGPSGRYRPAEEDLSMADPLNALKLQVIGKARDQVGQHYLWGGAGNTPGQADGAWYRKDHVELHENVPSLDDSDAAGRGAPRGPTPMLFAAWVRSSDKGHLACAGRAALLSGVAFPLSRIGANVRLALSLGLKDLKPEDLEELKKNAGTPDGFRWPRANGEIEKPDGGRTIWGESCLNKRHFDCIGFVNWCLSEALQKCVHYGIGNYTSGSIGTAIPLRTAAPGDIVTIEADHIGIVSQVGTAIDAMDSSHGVLERAIGEGHWKECYRLPESMWKLGAGLAECEREVKAKPKKKH